MGEKEDAKNKKKIKKSDLFSFVERK